MKRIVFDIDGTLCEERETFEKTLAKPIESTIDLINCCYDKGVFVLLYTGRSWLEYKATEKWLSENGVKYHTLICGKPIYDLWIDDRCLNPNYNIDEIRKAIYG